MANFPEIKPFRWWCHKILPLVYDDSLSYYELLCKVVAKMNEIIGQYDSFSEAIEALDTRISAVEGLDERVDEVESDLSEVEEKLEQLLYEMKGGTQGQVLAKASGSDWDFNWVTVAAAHGVPSGGSAGDILAKATGTDYDVEWVASSESHGVPSGGTSGQVLAKASNTDYDVEWVTGGGSGPEVVQSTGQSTTAVMSQKAVTDELADKADADALDDYVAIDDLAQSTGQSTTTTMSQKAITDAISGGGGDDKMDKVNPTGSGNMQINGTVSEDATKCVAFGDGYVDGLSSFALGDYTQVEGNYSAGIGLSNHIEGDGSFGVGTAINLEGNWSAGLGTNLQVWSNNQTVVGAFNVGDNTGANAFIVGGGSTGANRLNLMTVKASTGDLRVHGNIYTACNNDGSGGTMVVGGALKKLWENPTPQVTYAGGTIALSESALNFNNLLFVTKNGCFTNDTKNNFALTRWTPDGMYISSGPEMTFASRQYQWFKNQPTSITIGNGTVLHYGINEDGTITMRADTAASAAQIPIAIYGII